MNLDPPLMSLQEIFLLFYGENLNLAIKYEQNQINACQTSLMKSIKAEWSCRGLVDRALDL